MLWKKIDVGFWLDVAHQEISDITDTVYKRAADCPSHLSQVSPTVMPQPL